MNISIQDRIKSPSDLVESQGAKLLVYGESGVGKTTLCQTAPGKTLVVSMESGLSLLKMPLLSMQLRLRKLLR